jgi:hypothetical protein
LQIRWISGSKREWSKWRRNGLGRLKRLNESKWCLIDQQNAQKQEIQVSFNTPL